MKVSGRLKAGNLGQALEERQASGNLSFVFGVQEAVSAGSRLLLAAAEGGCWRFLAYG